MPLPFVGAAALGGAGVILDYAIGRPLNLWGRSIDADQAPDVRAAAYGGNYFRTNVLPSPDAIMEAARRGFINNEVAKRLLGYQGIAWAIGTLGQAERANGYNDWTTPAVSSPATRESRKAAIRMYGDTWEQVAKMRRSRPDPATVMALWEQERITVDDYAALASGLDWDGQLYATATRASYAVPGLGDLLALRRLGRITPEEYAAGARALGWYNQDWLKKQEQMTPLPGVALLMRNYELGAIDRNTYGEYMRALGHVDPRTRGLIESSFYQIPSGPELVNLAVRDAWDEQVVQRWGYDAEFPEPLRFWMRAQGWDWGQGFQGQDGHNYPATHWPRLLWRAHWQVLPPSLAYQMYRRLRPERLGRYSALFPGLSAFTKDDLDTVFKVHDYPPSARLWLAAVSSQPLRMYTIRAAYLRRVRSRDWAVEQLRDSGYVDEDSAAILDTIDANEEWRRNAGIRRLTEMQPAATAREVIAGYGAGLVPQQTALDRLFAVGIGTAEASRMLALEDSRQLRATVGEVVKAIRRSFLSGALSQDQAAAALAQAALQPLSIARHLTRWSAQRSLPRRSLATGQVASLVAQGALTPADALQRLANLGWPAPDAMLLAVQAEERRATNQARAAAQLVRQAAQQRRAKEAALHQAQAAVRRAQSDLRRITPVATLRAWFQKGIRTGQWIRDRLLSMGHDTASSDALLRQWTIEQQGTHGAEPIGTINTEQFYRRQTPLGTLKRWWQNGIESDSWIRERMGKLGLDQQAIDHYVSEWGATLGKGKTGPSPEAAPKA